MSDAVSMPSRKEVGDTAYLTELRARRRAAGLCHECTHPAEPGRARCAVHADRKRSLMTKIPVQQPCVRCGAETKQRASCPTCLAEVVFVPKVKAERVKPELESTIKARIRKAVIEAGCLLWVHNVDNRTMHTGLGDGTADLVGIAPRSGRFLGIEVKRPGYSPSDVRPAQRAWLAAVRKFGGVSGIATNEQEALALVAEARQSLELHV